MMAFLCWNGYLNHIIEHGWRERDSLQQHPFVRTEGSQQCDSQPPHQQELQRQRCPDLDQSDLRWCRYLFSQILKNITGVNKNFKFIANCIIMQKADCGLNISGSCFWDNEVDGTVTIKWDAPSLICIVNVFGCALWSHNLSHFTFTLLLINYIHIILSPVKLVILHYTSLATDSSNFTS